MMKKLRITGVALILLVSMFLAACGGGDSDSKDSKDSDLEVELGQEKLTLPYVAWARETVISYLLAEVLEEVGS